MISQSLTNPLRDTITEDENTLMIEVLFNDKAVLVP